MTLIDFRTGCALAVLSLGLAACGGGNDASTNGGGGSNTTPAAQVHLDAAPTDLTVGATVTLSWTSTNAAACVASGGWIGARAISGSESLTPPQGSTTYVLDCTGVGGAGTSSATVTVHPAAPEADQAGDEFKRAQQLEQGCCNATH